MECFFSLLFTVALPPIHLKSWAIFYPAKKSTWGLGKVWWFLDLEGHKRVKDIEQVLNYQFMSYFSTLIIYQGSVVLLRRKGALIPSSTYRLPTQENPIYYSNPSPTLYNSITKPLITWGQEKSQAASLTPGTNSRKLILARFSVLYMLPSAHLPTPRNNPLKIFLNLLSFLCS